jgi:hypothetical protein
MEHHGSEDAGELSQSARRLRRTLGIYSITLRIRFEEASGVAFEDFLKAAHVLYGLFSQLGSSIADHQLREAMSKQFSAATVDGTLRALSATRAGFRKYYEGRAAAQHAAGVVYEFNPLLR